MKERQVYIDKNDNSRIRVSFGSAGTLQTKHKLNIIFDAKTNNEQNASKSIIFDLSYDSTVDDAIKYVDANDAQTYAIINGNQTLSLTYLFISDTSTNPVSSSYVTSTYEICEDDTIKLSEHETNIGPNIYINGKLYQANTNGVAVELMHSKFVNEECEIADKANGTTYVNNAEAIRQYLLQHLSIMKHELWYNYEYGLPILQKGLTKAMIDAEVVLIISECPGIEDILSFDSYIENQHEYHLSFSIMTKYGKLDLIDTL